MSKIAAQMYTLRDFTKTGAELADTLKQLSKMGYPAVQLSAVGCMNGDEPEVNAAEARKMLDDNGLKCIATHRGWEALLNDLPAEIAFHQELGCEFCAIGSMPDEYRSEEGVRNFIRDAAPVLQGFGEAGITFGYHNHAFEFAVIGPGQRTQFDLLIDEAPELALEIDIYWIQHAGVTPDRVIERCHGRLPVIHLKDKDVDPEDGPVMAPIGEGNLDWAYIIPACEAAGVQWYAVEQDVCRRDPFDCMRSSFDFLSDMGL